MSTELERPAIRYITREGHRLYIHPQTGEFVPGVTSQIDNLPKPFLKAWGQKLVAEEAVQNHEAVGRLIEADPEAAVEYLKKTPNRFTARAAKDGHVAHEFFEQLALGNTVSAARENDGVRAMVDHFKDYLDTLQPTFLRLEDGVYDDTDPGHPWAGTFDAIARYDSPDVLVPAWDRLTGDPLGLAPLQGVAWQDNKTTRSGVHPEVGIQLSAYRHARWMIGRGGRLMLNKPGDHALVLHVRPEGWELVAVRATMVELDVFRTLRRVTDWTRDLSRQVIGGRVAGNRERRAVVKRGQLQIAAPDMGVLVAEVVE